MLRGERGFGRIVGGQTVVPDVKKLVHPRSQRLAPKVRETKAYIFWPRGILEGI
jgi:hypothetical protein